MDKRHRKFMRGERMMLLAGVCLCLVLISTYFTSGLYAKYSTGATDSDGASVIRFHQLMVTETGSFTESGDGKNQFIFAPGVPIEKNIKIYFGGSEAASLVFVVINAPEWVVTDGGINYTDSQGQLSWSVASGWTFLEKDQDRYVYYKALDPNETLEGVDFIKNGKIQVSSDGTVGMYASYPETLLSVKGYVVQANGFATVAEAWDSIK